MQCHNFEYILNVQQPVTHQNVHYPFHRFSLSLISSFFTNSWRGRERCVTQNCPTPEIRDMGPLVPDPKYICSETQTRIRADQRQRWKQNIIGAIIFFKYATCENYSKSASSSKCQSISMTYDYNTMGISRMKRILLSAFMVKYHIAYC